MAIRDLIFIRSEYEIEQMRRAGKEAARLLRLLGEQIKPNLRTIELDLLAVQIAKEKGFRNGPLGYLGGGVIPFPKSICTSVNDVVCHGIPSNQILNNGDIINVDVSPVVDGWYGDTSVTFCVGDITDQVSTLVQTTRECLEAGIAAAKPGCKLSEVGIAVSTLAESRGFSVVKELTGHGLGRIFHGAPTVYHWKNLSYDVGLMPGMIFTIEPMINIGSPDVYQLSDGWTIKTKNGLASAQFEHTVLITETGAEILTKE